MSCYGMANREAICDEPWIACSQCGFLSDKDDWEMSHTASGGVPDGWGILECHTINLQGQGSDYRHLHFCPVHWQERLARFPAQLVAE